MEPLMSDQLRIRIKSGILPLFICLIFIGMMLVRVPRSCAQETKHREYEVKAAFIYNFLKFVEWPPKALVNTGSLNICIIGDDPFGDSITAYEGEQVHNKNISIIRTSLQGIRNCHVVFISSSETEYLSHILNSMRGLNILSISDTDAFAQNGVIINLSIVQQKVRFEINISAARRAGLNISSKLLSLAKTVYE